MKLKTLFILFIFTSISFRAFATPQRIISLKPNVTEILFALGVGDRVVGVTRYCDYPQEVRKLPKVADYTRPFLEPIIALKPDIVIGSKEESSRKSIEELQNIGINVVWFPFTTLSETMDSISAIAELVGAKQKGDAIVKEMQSQLGQIRKQWRVSQKPKILVVLGRRPLIVAGPKSYIGEMTSIAGAQNVVTAQSMAYPRWSLENIIAANPDVILDMSMDVERAEEPADAMKFWQQFSTVNAVRNNLVYSFSITKLRQSPRLVDGIEKLGSMMQNYNVIPAKAGIP